MRWNYTEVLASADPGHTFKTQFVFSTLPGNGALPVSEWGALRDQIIGTAILVLLIFALTDLLNTPPKANLAPFIIGLHRGGDRHGVGRRRGIRHQPGP